VEFLRRLRTYGAEGAVILGFAAAGGALTYAEYELGLLDWVDPIGDNRKADFDVYGTLAFAQAVLLGLAAVRRWSGVTRLRLAAALIVGLAITVLELRAGWLDWMLSGADDDYSYRDGPDPFVAVLLNAGIAFGLGALAWRAFSPEG
jgi:hypothetical protein